MKPFTVTAPSSRTSARWRIATALAGILALAPAAGAQARWATLDDFLTRGIRLNAQELAALKRGETIARMLPTTDPQDIAVFGAVQIDVPRTFWAGRQRQFPAALRTPVRAQVQLFSDPAVLADVEAFDVDGDDLKELRSCRPSDCKIKLPATDMVQLRSVTGSGSDAKARVTTYARQRIVEYVNDYRARGNAAMVVYDDRGTVRATDALAAMLRDSSYVFAAVPALGQYLLDFPRATLPGATQAMFWSRDEMPHLRPVLRITHGTIFSPPDRTDVTIVSAKQIYADHYFEAGLEVLAAVDRSEGEAATNPRGITVVAVRRYRFDHLPSGGLLNIRGRVGNGLRENVSADLKRLKRDSETEWARQPGR